MADQTIAAVATAIGEAGIGIIRISGTKSIEISDRLFKSKNNKILSECENRKMNYGHIIDPETEKIVDEVLIVKMLAPHTYTTEDIVEINCHGGSISVRKILQLVIREGAVLAEAGEFTKRAFLNGRIDLTQAEAVMDLISAKTESVFDVSLKQLNGQLSKEISDIKDHILSMLAHIQVSIDYPEDDIDEVTFEELEIDGQKAYKKIKQLLKSVDTGKILRDGLKTVILGKPNVGKSSLMNAVLREERAIVTEIPGTTRDIIEEYVNIHGIPLKIVDTAGIRETDDIVEKIGVNKAKNLIAGADLIIAVFDKSEALSDEDLEIIELINEKQSIVLLNKTDLPSAFEISDISDKIKHKNIFEISALNNQGLDKLENTLKEMFFEGSINIKQDIIVTNVRHKIQLEKAIKNLEDALEAIKAGVTVDCIEVDLKDAWSNLGEISGDTVKEDIIDKIFKEFCVGK